MTSDEKRKRDEANYRELRRVIKRTIAGAMSAGFNPQMVSSEEMQGYIYSMINQMETLAREYAEQIESEHRRSA